MKKYLFVLSAIVLFAFSGCKKIAGDPVDKVFTIEGSYTALEVENAFDVTVSDAVDAITVTVGENVMPNVVVEKVDNTLKIHLKPLASSYGSEMKVLLPYNEHLTSVSLSGASEFRSDYGLEGDEVEVELSGASDFYSNIVAGDVDIELSGASSFFGDIQAADDIEMDLSGASSIKGAVGTADLDVKLSGASDATIIGEVTNLKMNLTGSSNIVKQVEGNRYALACDKCEGEVSGASDVFIHCDGIITVNLSGASDLHFTGNAFTGDCTTSGGSNIIHDVNP